MSLTVSQKIARKEKELATLKQQERKLETGQKIIIGGIMLSMARKDPRSANRLLELINKEVTRKTDLKRLEPLVNELKKNVSLSNPDNVQAN